MLPVSGRATWTRIAIIAAAMVVASLSHAATVRQVSLKQAVERSDLVFEGRAVAKANDTSGKLPHTCLVFKLTEVITGTYDKDHIRLCFAGGLKDGYRLAIPDMIYPKLGERGVFFVESLSRKQLNPLYGWAQGHYLIKNDGINPATVATAAGLSIYGVDGASGGVSGGEGAVTGKSQALGIHLSHSAAATSGTEAPALSLESFKTALRQMAGQPKP